MTTVRTSDAIVELDELSGALTWDARQAESRARHHKVNATHNETPRMTAAREAYAAAYTALGVAGIAYVDAVRAELDNLRGVR